MLPLHLSFISTCLHTKGGTASLCLLGDTLISWEPCNITKYSELNIEEMSSVSKSHIPAWLFLILVVTSKITRITVTEKIRGRSVLPQARILKDLFIYFARQHLCVSTWSVPLLVVCKQFVTFLLQNS